jgi:hypothetical protein
MSSGTREHRQEGSQPTPISGIGTLLVQDNREKGLVDLDFTVVFDEA